MVKKAQLGNTRTIDSGIIIKTNVLGNIIRTNTYKSNDIRLMKFVLPTSEADALYTYINTNIGKVTSYVFGSETVTGIVSSDEFELSTLRDGSCGIKSCSMRIRVITTSGIVGYTYACSGLLNSIQGESGAFIQAESGDYIYDN